MQTKKLLLVIIASVLFLLGIAVFIAYLFMFFAPEISFFGANTIAIIPLKGEITNEEQLFSKQKTAFEVIEDLEDAEENPNIAAIVLQINSPGGSVVASKQIVEKLQKIEKPVIAWISDYGASGAYYAAAASDHIMADSSSITGSIGVISLLPNISGLLRDFNIEMNVLKKGKFKDIGSPYKKLTEEEEQIFQQTLEQIFQEFKQDIKELRKDSLNLRKFEEIADGRFLTGKQALRIGLIDSLGSRETAIEKAASLAGIEEKPQIKDYSKKDLSLLELLSQAGYSFAQGFKISLQEPLTQTVSIR